MSAADRKSRTWRAILYPVLVLAAAVAFIIYSPNEKAKLDQIAQAPTKQAPRATMSAPADQLEKDTHDGDSFSAPSGSSDEESNAGFDDQGIDNKKLKVLDSLNRVSKPTNERGRGEDLGRSRAAGDSSATRLEADHQFLPPARASSSLKVDGATGPMASPAPALVAGEDRRKTEFGLPHATLVINCKMAPTAVSEKAFDTLLARNHLVAWSGPEPVADAKMDSARANRPSAAAPRGAEIVDNHAEADQAGKGFKVDESLPAKPSGPSATSQVRRNDGWSKSVVVELDARQLVAVLADLQKHPGEFLSVELPGQSADDQSLTTDTLVDSYEYSAAMPSDDAVVADEDTGIDAPESEAVPAKAKEAETSKLAQKGARDEAPQRLLVLFRLTAAGGN